MKATKVYHLSTHLLLQKTIVKHLHFQYHQKKKNNNKFWFNKNLNQIKNLEKTEWNN